jgi:acyl-CoA synthetase (AMP-forming)/AMP-acid ligase II
MKAEFKTLAEMLESRAQSHPDRIVFTFDPGLKDSKTESISYRDLDIQARAIAFHLQGVRCKAVILIFDCGLEFIVNFFGTIYAGGIPVPLYPAVTAKQLDRMFSIIQNCDASTVLTTSDILDSLTEINPNFITTSRINWRKLENVNVSKEYQWQDPAITNDSIALLQYTSGSTGEPKGAVLTHKNLLSNFSMISAAMEAKETDIMVSWLPMYHDMGLIGAILHTVFAGMQTVLMPPAAVVRPLRWLNAISKYRATATVAPNFAYDFCINRIEPEDIQKLDLASLRVAFNGAEPVHDSTLKNFQERFKSAKLRDDVFLPCYGLAEATLIVSGRNMSRPIRFKHIDLDALSDHRAVEVDTNVRNKVFVGCGRPCAGVKIRIVNPETFSDCAAKNIGEIWIAGPSVCSGYWNDCESNETTFMRDQGEVYLRTGDLGFLDEDGELYITGRIKDLIIIRGKNYHPHDLEFIAQNSHPFIHARPSAAFSIDSDYEDEKIILLQELKTSIDSAHRMEIKRAISEAINREHAIQISEIIFISPNSLARTTSGKIQRSEMRQRYLRNELNRY